MQVILSKTGYFETGLSKSIKKLTLFILSNPVTFNGQDHEKQKGPGTSDNHSLGYKISSGKFLY